MWELNHKKGWAPKNRCFRTVGLEKTLETPLDSKEIKPVNPKRNHPWICIGRTDAKGQIFWPPDTNSWFIGKDPDAGKDWGQVGKIEGRWRWGWQRIGWHHWFNGHEFEQTPGDCEGLGSLACCSPRSPKEFDTTEQLKTTPHLACTFVA